MGTGTLTKYNDGDVCPIAEHNDLVDAACGDFVPRDPITFVPGDKKGKLGNSNFRWSELHANKLFVGATADLMSIEDDGSGNLVFKLAGVVVATIKSTGFDRSALSAVNYALSSSASFSTSSATPADYATVNLTTSGRPVFVGLVGPATPARIQLFSTSTNQTLVGLHNFTRDGVVISQQEYANYIVANTALSRIPVSSFSFIDLAPPAGLHTYTAQAALTSGTGVFLTAGTGHQLLVYEMA